MGRGRNKAKAISAVVAIAAFVALVPVQNRIDSIREDLVSKGLMPPQTLRTAAVSAALGGFRGVAVDILWMQADSMLNDKQFYQLTTTYSLISLLQPNFPSVWTYNSWNLAFNISVEWGRPEEKWLWIEKGIGFGNKGLIHNPDSIELLQWVGWLYFFKVGNDPYFTRRFQESYGEAPYLKAAEYFEKALKVAADRGEMDIAVARLHIQALFHHGKALAAMGNVPEAMEFYGQAEEEAKTFLMDFPSDSALAKLHYDIKSEKDKYER